MTDENRAPISPPEHITPGDKAKKEREIVFDKGLSESGSLDDKSFNQLYIKKTTNIFRNITYGTFIFMIIVVSLSSYKQEYFNADLWVQLALIASAASSSIIRIFKQLSETALKSHGLG